MKLLFIDDDDIKFNTIHEYLIETERFIASITWKRSWQSGLIEILDNHEAYELVLLDMSMPRYDPEIGDVNEEFETFAGRDLLKEMKRTQVTIPVCVITSFDYFGTEDELINHENLDTALRDEFSPFYKGMIYFNSSQNDWKEKLNKILIGVVETHENFDR